MVTIEDQPWFVAADACKCLGLDISKGAYKHLEKVDDEGRRPIPPNILRSKGTAHLTVINESGLYTLILRAQDSRPEAAAFRRWVTREVLPSIRKTGSYVTGQPSLVENPNMDPLALLMAQAQLLRKMIASSLAIEQMQAQRAEIQKQAEAHQEGR